MRGKKNSLGTKRTGRALSLLHDQQLIKQLDHLTLDEARSLYRSEQFKRIKDQIFEAFMQWPADMDHPDRLGQGLVYLLNEFTIEEQNFLVTNWDKTQHSGELLMSMAVFSPWPVVDTILEETTGLTPVYHQLINGNRNLEWPHFENMAVKLGKKLGELPNKDRQTIARNLILRWLNYYTNLSSKQRKQCKAIWGEVESLVQLFSIDELQSILKNAVRPTYFDNEDLEYVLEKLRRMPHGNQTLEHLINQNFTTNQTLAVANPLNAIKNAASHMGSDLTPEMYSNYRSLSRAKIPSLSTIYKLYGNWDEAVKRADIK